MHNGTVSRQPVSVSLCVASPVTVCVCVCVSAVDSPVRTVAVCAGSGGSVLAGQQADLLLTGEMSHHEVRLRSDRR